MDLLWGTDCAGSADAIATGQLETKENSAVMKNTVFSGLLIIQIKFLI